jgi:UDP-N-acetyl-D-mannosaminuronic acid transferase (WecB/TagA/CpsF family)
MISKIIFRKIKFHNINFKDFKKYIIKKGLFVFPAGPALANIEKSNGYYESIKKADFVFFDSGLFVLLLKTFKNINVDKFSGYKFLNLFFDYLKENREKKVFCIDPNSKFSRSNKTFLRKLGIKKIYSYLAPKYNPLNLSDKKLLTLLRKKKPNFILTNIGGGTQEILGLYLKQKLGFKTTILCTGGAISFFTGDQAPINNFTDKFYLGWLIRLIFNPIVFFKRYVFGLRLIPMVIFNKITIIN